MKQISKSSSFAVLAAIATFGVSANAAQFSYLDPAYTQEIYTGPLVGGPGMAWTGGNNLLTRNGSDILEYSPTQNVTYQSTSLHSAIATHSIAGLNSSGYGLVKGTDGYIYTPTGSGLQRFDPNNWVAPAQSLAGTAGGQGYGVTSLSNGKIIYVAGGGTNEVYSYDPSSATNTLLYTAPTLLDDIEANSSGVIALAGQGNNSIILIDSAGSVLTSFATSGFPTAWHSATARPRPRCSATTTTAPSLSMTSVPDFLRRRRRSPSSLRAVPTATSLRGPGLRPLCEPVL